MTTERIALILTAIIMVTSFVIIWIFGLDAFMVGLLVVLACIFTSWLIYQGICTIIDELM
jgi:hypothetical protein